MNVMLQLHMHDDDAFISCCMQYPSDSINDRFIGLSKAPYHLEGQSPNGSRSDGDGELQIIECLWTELHILQNTLTCDMDRKLTVMEYK